MPLMFLHDMEAELPSQQKVPIFVQESDAKVDEIRPTPKWPL